MTTQTEKPMLSLDELEAKIGQRPTYASGGQIENFRKGWAHNIMGSGDTAHFYRKSGFEAARALCGKSVADARWIYGAGNYPRCRPCQRAADKRGLE